MRLVLETDASGGHRLAWPGGSARCAIGRSGIIAGKREGDGGTPVGAFPLRRVLYRPDRIARPLTFLPVSPIEADDGWCDDPAHPLYNRPVKLPFEAGHEKMWRDDGLYDIVVPLGHNDGPIVPGAGSAIFLHVARPDYGPTEGCVALAPDDLRAALRQAGPDAVLVIPPAPP